MVSRKWIFADMNQEIKLMEIRSQEEERNRETLNNSYCKRAIVMKDALVARQKSNSAVLILSSTMHPIW